MSRAATHPWGQTPMRETRRQMVAEVCCVEMLVGRGMPVQLFMANGTPCLGFTARTQTTTTPLKRAPLDVRIGATAILIALFVAALDIETSNENSGASWDPPQKLRGWLD